MTSMALRGLIVLVAAVAVATPIRAGEPEIAPPEKIVQRWIDQLGSERFRDREQATRELSKLGKSALPALKAASQSRDAEVRGRAQKLIDRIEPPVSPPVDALGQIRANLKIYL